MQGVGGGKQVELPIGSGYTQRPGFVRSVTVIDILLPREKYFV